jgi:glycosyltransferase involved in cell wall biosynthesis
VALNYLTQYYSLMANIIIDARELRTSTGRYIERLLHYLQQLESEHEFIVLLKPADMAGWVPTNSRFTKIACPHKEFTFDEQTGYLSQLNKIRTEHSSDLVHFALPQQPILYRGKTVTTIHDLTTMRFINPAKQALVFKLKQQVYKYVVKRAAQKSAAVIAISKFTQSDLVTFTGIDPAKIIVTYEAADVISTPPTPLKNLQKKQFIMYIGRPTPHKNLERLVEAFALLRPSHPELVLVLAGKKDANYERIEANISPELRPHVYFTDFVDEGQLRWLYEHCSAYVFPSLSEGFGLPGLEAMIHGAPVVSSNATCLPEIYGEAAHYFDPLDVPGMADAINEVLTDQDLRKKMIFAGLDQAHKYSWKRMAEQTLAVYNKVLED